jgi:hypothetical protein
MGGGMDRGVTRRLVEQAVCPVHTYQSLLLRYYSDTLDDMVDN